VGKSSDRKDTPAHRDRRSSHREVTFAQVCAPTKKPDVWTRNCDAPATDRDLSDGNCDRREVQRGRRDGNCDAPATDRDLSDGNRDRCERGATVSDRTSFTHSCLVVIRRHARFDVNVKVILEGTQVEVAVPDADVQKVDGLDPHVLASQRRAQEVEGSAPNEATAAVDAYGGDARRVREGSRTGLSSLRGLVHVRGGLPASAS
jgi:hypothetical protein